MLTYQHKRRIILRIEIEKGARIMLYEYWEEQLKQLEEELETTENEERKEELLELIENTKEQMLFAPTREDLWEYLHW